MDRSDASPSTSAGRLRAADKPSSSPSRHHTAPRLPASYGIALGLAGLALALYWGTILTRRFDGLYGQDAFAYYTYALRMWERVGALTLPPPFHWPVGYPALIAAGFLLTGFSPLAGQLVSSLAGAGVVLLTSLLAHELLVQERLPAADARRAAVLAGLLAAACGQLWQWSITVMADTPALCWATLAAWALVRYPRGRRLRWLVLAAAALAWAMMTRWVYALLGVPFALYWILALSRPPIRQADQEIRRHGETETIALSPGLPIFRSPDPPVSASQPSPTIAHLLAAALIGLVVLAPQIALSAAFPEPLLEHQWLVGWSPLNAVRSSFETVDGYAIYSLPVALFYAKAAASPRYLFPLFTPFLFLGLVVVARRRWWPAAALLIGWGAIIYGFLCGIPYQNFRFTLALLPPEAILTSIGLQQAWHWLAPRWRPLLLACLIAGLLGGLWYSGRVVDEFLDRKEADLAVVRWVAGQVPPDGQVLAFGITLTLQHYTPLDVHEIFFLAPADLQRLLANDRPTYLVVAVDDLERQWRGYAPERAYRWLRDGPGLAPLGIRSGYTLFRVGR